ncbi:MAG TPA: anthranilate phosphoribosyltransferase [Methylomirabilota bacterium]|nr:anthranilate phosphoribosyltransferase [Methylomirabilota bacterium]
MLLDSGLRPIYRPTVLRDLIVSYLSKGMDLPEDGIKSAVASLVDSGVMPEEKADFLCALAAKGETAIEIAGFAQHLRSLSTVPPISRDVRALGILDVCGTGGDHQNTFNISTTVALIAAASGVYVAKHGNRAITSTSGSADVLEALGVRIDLLPHEAAACLEKHQFAFFFAQNYHPAFRHIGPARKICAERKQRTIFNLMGPLLNPAHPSAQLVGVPRPEYCEPIAHVLQSLGVSRAMVVSGALGEGFLDEVSLGGPTTIAEFYQDRGFSLSTLTPDDFGLAPASAEAIRGGSREDNAATLRAILAGEEKGPKLSATLLNAGAALFVAGRTRSIGDGIDMAQQMISSGAALAKLEAVRKFEPNH